MNNYGEFVAGTDPLDSQSSLRLGISPTNSNSHELSWSAVSNKSYTVQTTSNLAAPAWQRYQDISARPSNSVIAVPVSPTNTSSFFRLTTPQQP